MYIKAASIFALAVTSAVATPTPAFTTRAQSINPPASVIHARDLEPLSQMQARALTNSKRLAMGLRLNPPKLRRGSRQQPARASPSASGSPSTTGYIQMVECDGEKVIGYVGKQLNSFGEYGRIAKSEDEALKVKFNLGVATKRHTDISTLNGPDSEYPFFGAINGKASTSSDIGPGSPNYQYLGGTKQTSAYSPPSSPGNSFTTATKIPETSESAIWRYNTKTWDITPHYVNTDNSKPRTYTGINEDEVLVLTGDKDAFTSSFGTVTWVTLRFVPA